MIMRTGFFLLGLILSASVSGEEISYGDHPAQDMDLYFPQDPTNAPVMLYVYGVAGAGEINIYRHF